MREDKAMINRHEEEEEKDKKKKTQERKNEGMLDRKK